MMTRALVLSGLISAVAMGQGSGREVRRTAPSAALDGYCPVCLVKADKLVEGERHIYSIYDGKKYLFPSTEQKEMFDENPASFAPAMGGACVVCKVEMNKVVPGKAEHRLVYEGRLYLFPSEKQLEMFKKDPKKYADVDVAMDGYCPVCKIDMGKDVKGKPELAIDYKGTRYLFPGKEQMERFRQNPRKYAGR